MSNFSQFHNPYDGSHKPSMPIPDKTLHGMNIASRRARIKSIDKLTYDTIALIVEYDGGGEDIKPVAGQYATLKPDHLEKPRAYSFARAPEQEKSGEHTFFIRLLDGGLFSTWLFEKERVGCSLT